jgi:hypothetical protein
MRPIQVHANMAALVQLGPNLRHPAISSMSWLGPGVSCELSGLQMHTGVQRNLEAVQHNGRNKCTLT